MLGSDQDFLSRLAPATTAASSPTGYTTGRGRRESGYWGWGKRKGLRQSLRVA
jgi:hypothetical protein